jgi:hypothetical protein
MSFRAASNGRFLTPKNGVRNDNPEFLNKLLGLRRRNGHGFVAL